MFTEFEFYGTYMKTMWNRLQILRKDDQGMTTETLIITATLVVAAVVALGIITARITTESNRISSNPSP